MPSPGPAPAPAPGRAAPRLPTRARDRATVVLAALLAALLLVTLLGCSGEDGPADTPGGSGATRDGGEAGPPPLATTVRVGEVVGRTRPAARTHAVRAVGRVVDGWVDAAYVEGPWPRRRFSGSFPRFTRGARTQALGDGRLMSNAGIGRRIDGVRATQRRVVVDLLADRRLRPTAATARVQLAYRTTGGVEETFRVRGRLFLTRTRTGWRVFGYDLTKGSR